MKQKMKLQLTLIFLCLMADGFWRRYDPPSIIPLPQKMERREGVFRLQSKSRVKGVRILADAASKRRGKFLADSSAKPRVTRCLSSG